MTAAEYEVLINDYKTNNGKNQFLLSILPSKGENALECFIKCLEEEKEHLGHVELAAQMKSLL